MFSYEEGRPIAYTDDDTLHIADPIRRRKGKEKKMAHNCSKHEETDEDDSYIPLMNSDEREVWYICGPSGSGKSTFAADLINEWKHDYPKGDVFIFSRTNHKSDPAFKKIKMIQIDINEGLLEDPINIENEISEDSLIIFDDVTTIHDKELKDAVEHLMVDIMEVGRKMRIWIIVTSHLIIPNEKKFARTVLNEMQKLVVFPKGGGIQQIRYALKTYFGYSNRQIDDFINTDSRWLVFSKTYPQYILSETEAIIP